jgi:hypothetical protein
MKILRKIRRFLGGKYLRELERQNADLQARVKAQGTEIHIQQDISTYRNKQLEALHVVWCNGGCRGGVGCMDQIDEAKVLEAERNVKRIREWWTRRWYRIHECKECSSKSGSPTLCEMCQRRREQAEDKWMGPLPK